MDHRRQPHGYPYLKGGNSTFVRQTKSRPIAIVHPQSGQIQQHGKYTPQQSDFPPLGAINLLVPPVPPLPPSTDSLTAHDKPMPKRSTQPNATNDEFEPGFNVYARPFVPESFTIINTLNGQIIDTPAGRRIDFDAYVRSYLGSNFLPPIPEPDENPESDVSAPGTTSIHKLYERHLRSCLEDEIRSQRKENELYNLYGHDVTLISPQTNGEPATCSFHVPGLRENSPYVEEGDTVQLRQVRYDHNKRPFGMEHWLAPLPPFNQYGIPGMPIAGGKWRGDPAPGWTGIIYNARVAAVQRKQEQLFVKVTGLNSNSMQFAMSPGTATLKFNIQFPVQVDRYLPMLRILPIIRNALIYGETGVSHNGSLITARRQWLESMLVPTEMHNELQTKLNPGFSKRTYFDHELNWEQQKSIESICNQNYGSLPFLISGPPGTGKTKTLVETALQLVNNVEGVSHILFCAPSDPAADTLVQRLSRTMNNPSDLLRLNRISRTFAEVPDAVMPYCYISQNTFCLPALRDLMRYKIVVTTCRDAALLVYSRMTNADLYAVETGLLSALHHDYVPPSRVKLHWTALLIDEAAQALEPEALLPLSVVAPPINPIELEFKPLVCMAGDQHQLGPRTSLRSSPLQMSLFARLFARFVYANHPLARGATGQAPPPLNSTMLPIRRPAFANLIRNYRSHPAILAIPSALFYNDTLEPEATDTDRLASWSGWKGKGWPVLFHNNSSADELEGDGGGWYNSVEAKIACRYAARLVETGLVGQKEVCIMSPFKSQVARLRKTIREPQFGSLWDVDIGPMEAFQGLERGVVILCTTRSRQRFVAKDKALDWGIIGMPNKMNVALTRAKFGLIVIGKNDVLREDPNWNSWLEFCYRNGLVDGETGEIKIMSEGSLTRLEKVLSSRERDEYEIADGRKRQLDVYPQEDEMWTSGMAAALELESVDAALEKVIGNGYGYEDN
jgi:DNA polymerase III delta prime subunit